MKSNNIIITSLFLTLLVAIVGCGNNGQNSNSNSQTKQKEEAQTVDGTYSYKDNSAELVITISGNSWSGKTMMVTGFGSDYDNQNAQYDNGIVKGNDLYESSGMGKSSIFMLLLSNRKHSNPSTTNLRPTQSTDRYGQV